MKWKVGNAHKTLVFPLLIPVITTATSKYLGLATYYDASNIFKTMQTFISDPMKGVIDNARVTFAIFYPPYKSSLALEQHYHTKPHLRVNHTHKHKTRSNCTDHTPCHTHPPPDGGEGLLAGHAGLGLLVWYPAVDHGTGHVVHTTRDAAHLLVHESLHLHRLLPGNPGRGESEGKKI